MTRVDGIVFSGGGCRCFWQAGWWSTAAPALDLRPRAIAAVSAGAAFACAAIGGVLPDVVHQFVQRTTANRRNFYPWHLVGKRPAFPHAQMYRETILAALDARVVACVRAGPEIRVLLTRPPPGMDARSALVMGLAAYNFDRFVRNGLHSTLPRRLGFRPWVVPAGGCTTTAELADLILQSSCLPPLTPLYRREGTVVLDGAVMDGSPVDLVDDCAQTLVLLSRRFAQLPRHPRRHYVQPSQPVPIAMWDYASPRLVEQTFDLGRRDGESFARQWRV